jgi:hypothetical protein
MNHPLPPPTFPNGPENPAGLPSSSPRLFTREELEAIVVTSPLVLVEIILALQAQIQALQIRVSELEAQIEKNSKTRANPLPRMAI